MKKYNFNNQEVTVYYAGSLLVGYGHHKITVEMELNGEYKKFIATTNNMRGLDAAKELERQDKYETLYELIESDIDAEISDWVLEITE
jgi:hypothetical protein